MEAVIRQEAGWILAQQLPSGAVVTAYPGRPKIVPYFAHLALYGLAAWGLSLPRVRAYLDWYLAHLERPDRYGVTGTVYDYYLERKSIGEGVEDAASTEVPAYSYDSSDSYAATFLTLVRCYCEASGEREWVAHHLPELELVAGAMLATLQKDNLTLARPDWKVKYLMDNCEVYQGLKDYAWLLARVRGYAGEARMPNGHLGAEGEKKVSKYAQEAGRYAALAARVKDAIQAKMLLDGGYCPAIYRAGLRRRPNWKKWYPDALAQLFPIITGVLTPREEAARRLYANFLRNYPHWYRQTQPENFITTLVAYAATLMEDRWRVRQYVEGLEENIIARGHPWPYHAAEAGILLLALKTYLAGGVKV
ncbi:hypothetical protein [Neomoorella thermoacetica]|uniref:hypothetical protein n=2 Tax=Neomoorella thermoacetica TaxID=1525 RepID=UPI0008FA775F|nr:hypothetical protein [Moorella thermoacetica]OIQ12369.1 hypothetical protein MOOTH_06970 [Moorella thermoacetica]